MSEPRTIIVRTGSRLHFGLWAWGAGHERQFGGVGMMVDHPEQVIRFSSARSFEAVGPASGRMREVAERCCLSWNVAELPHCRIETVSLPRQHSGIGVGTQLNLAVARGFAEWIGKSAISAASLVTEAGRGLRSAVGSHGFAHGGLIVDAGKRDDQSLGELACRIAVPRDWRIVLITPSAAEGIAGDAERLVFAKLPPVPTSTTERLQWLAFEEIIPATEAADFERFTAAVYEYGRLAGNCFESVQGGVYSSKATKQLADLLHDMKIVGVGQSSWGPTVFAFVPSARTALELVSLLNSKLEPSDYDMVVTCAKNDGARVAKQ
ncbi:MAG: hypothetical protein ACR2NU_12200 [Aeoliella sp.]